ncbi:hypothetical protein V499_00544 [Pseudogymnoascus sp. VKM F-103]|uniref:Uncharacterized protein n=1 Tax=Pseudogymnoascus verrucosus TaxID=342668 RepID=A0A1B8GX36_9PEZI|nr:uncharacterized protein VE01_01649 [Pseudogymnoascus verrucosus]KFY80623.1 hypothetical protein V499_00544 [Pseudogymnoascus sp. VKM F-103]OBU00379.1 hypothetical protein VE01_01649 [Pseudogymnoascus verrucosus]
MTSHFATVPALNEDAAFGIMRLARVDLHPKATSLNAGLHRDEKENPWILPPSGGSRGARIASFKWPNYAETNRPIRPKIDYMKIQLPIMSTCQFVETPSY